MRRTAFYALPIMAAVLFSLAASNHALAEHPTNVSEIRFIQHLDAFSALQEIQNGTFDMYYSPVPYSAVSDDDVDLTGVDVYHNKEDGIYSLLVNPASVEGTFNPFAFQEIRYSLNYLIDRDMMIDELFGGQATVMLSTFSPYEPDYLLVHRQLESLGITYDPEKADDIISDVLANNGAVKHSDGLWYMDGKPIEVKIFIRDDKPIRKSMAQSIISELEKIGFTIERIHGNLEDAYGIVYSSDPANFDWHIYVEGFGGSRVTLYDNSELAAFYAPWAGSMPGYGEPSFWNYENDLLDSMTRTIYNESYDSIEERADLVRLATLEGVNDAVRTFIISADGTYVVSDDLEGIVSVQGDGITTRFTPINVNGKDPLVIGVQHITQASWNPIGGFSDVYSNNIWNILRDPIGTRDPFSGTLVPIRSTWSVETSPENGIAIPEQAILWDLEDASWKTVDAGSTATSKVTYDLSLSNWHNGVPMSINDILYTVYFTEEWSHQNGEDDPRYIQGLLPTNIAGINIVDHDTIEVYADYYHRDSDEIAAYLALWSTMPWEIYAAIEEVTIAGHAHFMSSTAKANGVPWLSLIEETDVAHVRQALADLAAANYTPPAVLDEYQNAGNAAARYAASMDWIDAKDHAIISNGPFYMDPTPTSTSITVRSFDDGTYPIPAGHWGYLAEGAGALKGQVTLGALAPLSGGADRYGLDISEAAKLAVSDFNSYLEVRGEDWSLNLDMRDTQTNPEVALEQIKALHREGNTVINGPAIDIITDEIMDYIDDQDLVAVSCCSAVPSLAEDDSFFRMVPDHTHHAERMADLIDMHEIEVVIPVSRDAPWTNELLGPMAAMLESDHGISVADAITYKETDVGNLVAVGFRLASATEQAIEDYGGADKVGIVYVGFEESVRFLVYAAQHRVLDDVQWFGADLNTVHPNISDHETARMFAAKTGMLVVQPTVADNEISAEIESYLTNTLGRAPSVYSNFEYDAIWLIGLSMLETRSTDSGRIVDNLPSAASRYVGAIGSTELNEAGDLKDGIYAVWTMTTDGQWVDVTENYALHEFKIGSLVTSVDDPSASGTQRKYAAEVAVEDFNNYLKDKGVRNWNMTLDTRNTMLDTETAVKESLSLHEDGVNFISGPSRSSSVRAIQDAIQQNDLDLSLVSCCSTAPDLGQNDNIFRLAPSDDKHGPVIADLLNKDGKKVLIPVWVNDAFGRGLVDTTAETFMDLGGHTVFEPLVDPASYEGYAGDMYGAGTSTTPSLAHNECTDLNGALDGRGNPTCDDQFGPLVSDLNDIVVDAIRMYGADRVAVLYVGFDSVEFVREAAKYDLLRTVQWIGSDSDVLKQSMVTDENSDVRSFLVDSNFRSCIFEGDPSSARFLQLTDRLAEKFPGFDYNTYLYSTYDTVWTIGLAVEAAGGPNSSFEDIVSQIPGVVESNTGGALGPVSLNAGGDLANANYAVYGIERDDESGWQRIGTYYTDGRFVQTYEDPIKTLKMGALMALSRDVGFNDPDYALVMPLARQDFNDNAAASLQLDISTIDVATGALAALNTLHHGAYDDFYYGQLKAVIDETISAYSPGQGGFDAINDQYRNTPLYPFVFDSDGAVIAHGYDSGNIGNVDIDDLRATDRTPDEVFEIFGESGAPEELWWQYVFYNPASGADAIKRSLLVYHEESGMVVGAGYHPFFGGDQGHEAALGETIDEAILLVTAGSSPDISKLDDTYDYDTASTPFYAYVLNRDGSVLASAAHPDSVGLNISGLKDIDTTIDQINAALAEDGDTTWISYAFNNPATGLEQSKRALLKLVVVGDAEYIFGSGYYVYNPLSNFLGPMTSANTEKVRQYANDNGLVILSPTSTAGSLAIPDDNVFRLTPPDTTRTAIVGDMMVSDSKTHVVVVQRDDVWGWGVGDTIEASGSFEQLYRGTDTDGDGTVDSLLLPVSYEHFDFGMLAERLAAEVATAREASGSLDSVAVLYAGFANNKISLFRAIDGLEDPGDLLDVDYYATTAATGNTAVTADEATSRILSGTGFKSLFLEVPLNDISLELKQRLERIDTDFSSYSSSVYDSVHIMGHAIESADASDGLVSVRDVVASTSGYRGALDNSEGITLDEYGDVVVSTDFFVPYSIVSDGQGKYEWKRLEAQLPKDLQPWTQLVLDLREQKSTGFQSTFPVDTEDGINRLLAWAGNPQPNKAQDNNPELAKYAHIYTAMKRWNERIDLKQFIPEANLAADMPRLLTWAGNPEVLARAGNADLEAHEPTYVLLRLFFLERDDLRNHPVFKGALDGSDLGSLYCWAQNGPDPRLVPHIQFYADACASALSGHVDVGVLIPITGMSTNLASQIHDATLLGINNFNEHLLAHGHNWQMRAMLEDTELDPSVAREKLISIHERGTSVVIGPTSSANVEHVKPYADANQMLLLSCCSSAQSLAVPGDSVYRLTPNGASQAAALAELIRAQNSGAGAVVPVYRDDTWGRSLVSTAVTLLSEMGISVSDPLRYDPTTTQFGPIAASLADEVSRQSEVHGGTDNVAVMLLEFGSLLPLMDESSTYGILSDVKWFGTDANAYDPDLVSDKPGAAFARDVGYTVPMFAVEPNEVSKYLRSALAALGSVDEDQVNPVAYSSYDSAWVLGLSMMQANSDSGQAVRAVIPDVAAHYRGALGDIVLNDAGDLESATYLMVGIRDGQWEVLGDIRPTNASMTGEEKAVMDLVQQTVDLYKAEGSDALAMITAQSATYEPGTLYPFVLDAETMTVVAHGANSAHVGNISVLLTQGDRPAAQIISDLESGGGTWVEYVFVNPATGMDQEKRSWLVAHDGYIFGSGYYV